MTLIYKGIYQVCVSILKECEKNEIYFYVLRGGGDKCL